MHRMRKGVMALLFGVVTLASGRAALAQSQLPVLKGVTVAPSTLSAPGQVSITVPGFEGEFGCKFGQILAGSSITDSVLLLKQDFDRPQTFKVDKFETGPFVAGTYSIFVRCTDDNLDTKEYATDQTLTILPSATTTTTTTTTTAPPASSTVAPRSVEGSVNPTTAKPGETTIELRGGGFKVGAPLQITLASTPAVPLGTATAPDGFYATTLKLPLNAPPGTHNVVVSGPAADDTTRTTSAALTVTDLDCADFRGNPQAAQGALAGGRDPHGLDGDKDGTACEAASTRTAAGTGGGTAAAPAGDLAQTGSQRTELGIMVGLTAMTLGALLLGLSHPAEPASGRHGRHRRRRR